jgi:NAD(P)-dependent dehydrogenase (short-subunit alcohol dehydrogenase family)
MSKIWFITGATRGLGTDIAKAALAAGHSVVATGRNRQALTQALGSDNDRLLTVALDVTDEGQASAAVEAAVARFGTIDVLVNNAGYGHLGFFEETSDEDVRQQFETNVFGVFYVIRAALPVMRQARRGHIFNISSIAGLRGGAGASLYCASKHALEGFSESLAREIEPLGLRVTLVEPGRFRTDFLAPDSIRFAGKEIDDYVEASRQLQSYFAQQNGQQAGDPAKLAAALVRLADEANPPLRFVAGPDAVEQTEAKIDLLQGDLDTWRALSVSTNGEYA